MAGLAWIVSKDPCSTKCPRAQFRPSAKGHYNPPITDHPRLAHKRASLPLATAILLLAAFLRFYRLADLPPGWRDDEVVETAVHAALVLEGRGPLYFPQAEGHEPLYHYLSAVWIAVAGRSLLAVRLLSAFFGLFSVAALYRLASLLFGPRVALLAAAALAISFWSLMYSRFKLRHIAEPGFMLLAFYFYFRALRPRAHAVREALLAGLCLTLTLYTYFAARAVPFILLAFAGYLALVHRRLFRRGWPPMALAFAVAALLAAPLAAAIALAPGGEARLAVVGRPLQDLLSGDPAYALDNARTTLGMFAFTGDPEYLYNIPGRPVFEWLGALLFVAGMALSFWRWRQPRYAFLLVWLVGGLSPAFVSTPGASLGHTITAQPVAYLLPALAVVELAPRLVRRPPWAGALSLALAALLLGLTAARDWRAYFVDWPSLPMVRLLYRADLHSAAPELRALPAGSDLGLASGRLLPADVVALALETPGRGLRPRAFNPEWAWPFPERAVPVLLRASAPGAEAFGQPPLAGEYALRPSTLTEAAQPAVALQAGFENGWTFTGYTLVSQPGVLQLATYWLMRADYTPPAARPVEVLSGVPLSLRIFSHVLWPDGSRAAGDDRLDVDPATLQPGDTFIQKLRIEVPAQVPAGRYAVQIGLYDPQSGVRVRLESGDDRLLLGQVPVQP